jgi:hypothetical protein
LKAFDTTCVQVVALLKRVFLRHVAKMGDRFLEQEFSIKFSVKLGNNANDICAMLSEAYREEGMKKVKWF